MIPTVCAVARVEFLLLIRDRRFLLAGVALWLMVGIMLTASQSHFVREQQQLRAAQRTARQQWESRTGQSGHALGHYGTYVYRDANPFSLLHPGAEPYVGVAAHIIAHHQTNMFYRPMLDRGAIDRWADISVSALLQLFVPLFLLLLAFGSIAGDREDGRLRLFLGQGTAPLAFALGKLAGLMAVAATLLLPAFSIVTLLLFRTAYMLGETGDLAGRLLILLAGYTALYLFFLALGLVISCLFSTRQGALLCAVGLWALLCLVTPRVLTVYAETRFPTPEEDVVHERIETERKDRKALIAVHERVKRDALQRYNVKDPADLPVNLDALTVQAVEEHVNGIHDRNMGLVWSQFAAQENWASAAGGLLTPAISMRNLSETISNTDPASLREHVRAIETFRRDWVRRLNEADAHREHSADGEVPWATFPAFHHQPPTLAAQAPHALNNLAALWLWAGFSIGAAIVCVRLRSGTNGALS